MKNKLADLNNHLFMEIERLGDEDVKGDALKEEIGRAQEICNVAGRIIDNGRLVLDAVKATDNLSRDIKMPLLLE